MGLYYSLFDNPCPRCGGTVAQQFISVTPMSWHRWCGGCGATDFTEDETAALGGQCGASINADGELARHTWRPVSATEEDA